MAMGIATTQGWKFQVGSGDILFRMARMRYGSSIESHSDSEREGKMCSPTAPRFSDLHGRTQN